jgi:N-formylmaleamate deformylase
LPFYETRFKISYLMKRPSRFVRGVEAGIYGEVRHIQVRINMKGVKMAEYKQDFVKTDGVNIHYYRKGRGSSSIILLHGATDNGLCWTPVADMLAENYDVIMPDAQGHGKSDRIGQDYNPVSSARHVAGLIRELQINKPVIMGHSMGAGTTVNVAVNYPDLPKAIILEDPGWRTEGTDEEDARKQREDIGERSQRYTKLTQEELAEECRKDNPAWPEAEIIPWSEAKLQFDINMFSFPRQFVPYTELVPKITCPTLLITSDGGLVDDNAARHASSIWKAESPLQWVKINGAGHNIRREQFNTFCDTINKFLNSL